VVERATERGRQALDPDLLARGLAARLFGPLLGLHDAGIDAQERRGGLGHVTQRVEEVLVQRERGRVAVEVGHPESPADLPQQRVCHVMTPDPWATHATFP
jgi:hypothetical protein